MTPVFHPWPMPSTPIKPAGLSTPFPRWFYSTHNCHWLNKNSNKLNLAAAIPKPTHDAAWWEARTKGFDFSVEDRVPTEQFNHVIWEGLMGNKPYPTIRSGTDLRQNREVLLKSFTSQAVTPESSSSGGSK